MIPPLGYYMQIIQSIVPYSISCVDYSRLSVMEHPFFLASGNFVPCPWIEPVPPALKMWIPNHWAAREAPGHPN